MFSISGLIGLRLADKLKSKSGSGQAQHLWSVDNSVSLPKTHFEHGESKSYGALKLKEIKSCCIKTLRITPQENANTFDRIFIHFVFTYFYTNFCEATYSTT